MSKHETFTAYPSRGLAAAESALLTIWPTLSRYQDDLVLVGGLAIHHLTSREGSNWPGAVTMDVDFGIELSAGGDQYSLRSDLAGIGFHADRYESAIQALRRDFIDINADGPIRAADFLRGTRGDLIRAREELVTAARFLLGE